MNYHIYCDESRQTKDRYMVIGGIIIPEENVDIFNQTMEKFRQEENMRAELKWSKVTNQKLAKYLRFVDYFFALNNTDKLHFHATIIDNHRMDYKRFSKGDREEGFYKFYYELLLQSFGRHADSHTKFFIYLEFSSVPKIESAQKTYICPCKNRYPWASLFKGVPRQSRGFRSIVALTALTILLNKTQNVKKIFRA